MRVGNIELTARDICAIVRECSKAGVSELTLGELKITYGRAHTTATAPDGFGDTTLQAIHRSALKASEESEVIAKQDLEHDEFRLRERQMELMLFEDPLALENMIASGEAVNEATDHREA